MQSYTANYISHNNNNNFFAGAEPSHNSLNLAEPHETAESIHFYRDLNPYMRRFNTKRPQDDNKQKRSIQLQLFEQHFGGADMEQPNTGNNEPQPIYFTHDIYLMGLTQLVPIDKMLNRLAKTSARWDGIAREDPVVSEYLMQLDHDEQLDVIMEEESTSRGFMQDTTTVQQSVERSRFGADDESEEEEAESPEPSMMLRDESVIEHDTPQRVEESAIIEEVIKVKQPREKQMAEATPKVLPQSMLTRQVSNANMEINEHLERIERLLKEKGEQKVVQEQIKEHIESMIQLLDAGASYNYDDEDTVSKGTPKNQGGQIFEIATETILRGSALADHDLIDEQLQAKFLPRLLREYRRNLERQQRNNTYHTPTQHFNQDLPLPSLNQSLSHPVNASRTMKEVTLFDIQEIQQQKQSPVRYKPAPKMINPQSERIITLPFSNSVKKHFPYAVDTQKSANGSALKPPALVAKNKPKHFNSSAKALKQQPLNRGNARIQYTPSTAMMVKTNMKRVKKQQQQQQDIGPQGGDYEDEWIGGASDSLERKTSSTGSWINKGSTNPFASSETLQNNIAYI
ncbi:hypothetical protein FGO68_gene8990 [Halteria grandinella]|uniref:Uncharacterized protein n=1 Tax=Halteria grandinella TaxID=5974 RepID=A0A8J8NEE5_HALGN|nr:hypothetical protein FGO68_gene8990 [Halteria grandinella]